jgi:hypothetical protein
VTWNTGETLPDLDGLSLVFTNVHYSNIENGLFSTDTSFGDGYIAISSRVENPICWNPEAPPTGMLITYKTVVRDSAGICCATITSNSQNRQATIDWSLLYVNSEVQPYPAVDVPGR